MASKHSFIFRRAKSEDIKEVLQMIQELADFEKMSQGPKLTEQTLRTDAGLDGGQAFCHVYVLEAKENTNLKMIGYAVCYFSYSTWEGKSYFLEDIYVRPDYRGRGTGGHLFREVAAKALSYNCKRMDFHVLKWNPACQFYKSLGAIDITESEEFHCYRMNEAALVKLVLACS